MVLFGWLAIMVVLIVVVVVVMMVAAAVASLEPGTSQQSSIADFSSNMMARITSENEGLYALHQHKNGPTNHLGSARRSRQPSWRRRSRPRRCRRPSGR